RRETQMSWSRLPGRSLLKNNQCPSREREGGPSVATVFTRSPRFTGRPQGSSGLARCETQMSVAPKPGRVEVKKRLRPSLEIAGPKSSNDELTVAPRFVGTSQSENRGAAPSCDVRATA